MEKPKPKKEVAIKTISKSGKFITFYGSPDAIEDFKEFGLLTPQADYYWLWIDERFDFDEVLSYIKNYE